MHNLFVMKKLYFFVLLFFPFFTQAQPTYDFYTQADKITIFADEFNADFNDWSKGGIYTRAEIYKGTYACQSLVMQAALFTRRVDIDESKDFEIEAKIRFLDGQAYSMNALIWGASEVSDYAFGFTGQGNSYRLRADKSGMFTNYIPWKEDKQLIKNKGEYNIFTIRKVGNDYHFYINRQRVHSMPFQTFFGKEIGFMVAGESAIQIDYLRVNYLAKKIVNTPPEIFVYEPTQSQRGFQVVSANTIRVFGKAVDTDGIKHVLINNIKVPLDNQSQFLKELAVHKGKNYITIEAIDTKGASSFRTIAVEGETVVNNTTTNNNNTNNTTNTNVITTEKRMALVIGNADYQHGGDLLNPENDARSMKKALEALNFEVMIVENSDVRAMKVAIDDFGEKIKEKNAKIALFFYAGHGIQVNGNNYIVPTDAKLDNEKQVEYDCVRADRVIDNMSAAGATTNIVILDACRDNPFARSWSRSTQNSGLAFMNAPSGTLIAYATSPGNTASDGEGSNGLYTSAILKHINTQNISVLEMFQRVRKDVRAGSNNMQTPWESTSLEGNFYFSTNK